MRCRYQYAVLRFFVLVVLISCRQVCVHLSPETPLPPQDPACLAELLASDNNQVLTRTFEVKEETRVRIVGQAEGTSFSLTPGFVEPFLNDCIEFFIYLGTVCRQYRFVWGSDLVSGNNVEMEGVHFAQRDPSPTRYVFEIAFPWETFGLEETPSDRAVLSMDVSAIDNDGESRKSQIAWSGRDAELWRDWSQFGSFPLMGHKTATAPIVDGLEDAVWKGQERLSVSHVILGTVRDNADLSAWYRLLWDREYLYLLVEVEDDIKRQAAFLYDRGCLTDKGGNVLWQLSFDQSFHAGGALKNRRQEDTLWLPAGRYTIHYETDESHATGHWDDLPPEAPYSGIRLYEID